MVIIPEHWLPQAEPEAAPTLIEGAIGAPLNDLPRASTLRKQGASGPAVARPTPAEGPAPAYQPDRREAAPSEASRHRPAVAADLHQARPLDQSKPVVERPSGLKPQHAAEWCLLVALRHAVNDCKNAAAAVDKSNETLQVEMTGVVKAVAALRGHVDSYRDDAAVEEIASPCLMGLDAFLAEVAARGCTVWAVGAIACGLKGAEELWGRCGRPSELRRVLQPAIDAWTRAAELRRGVESCAAGYQTHRAEFTSAEIAVATAFKRLSRTQNTAAAADDHAGLRRACLDIGRALIAGPAGLDCSALDAASKRLDLHAQALLDG